MTNASRLVSTGSRLLKQMASQQPTAQAAKKAASGATTAGQSRPGFAPPGLNARAGGGKAHSGSASPQTRGSLASFQSGAAFQSPQGAFPLRPGTGLQHLQSVRPLNTVAAAESTITAREAALPGVYTAIPADNLPEHADNQKRLEAGVQKFLQQASVQAEIAAGKDVRDCVADALPGLLEQAQLSTDIYQPKDATQLAGYGRYLLHSHAKEGESFCLQLFAFDARQKTPIHDHPNECASFILKGNLSERIYRPTGETKDKTPLADKTDKNARPQGSWAGFGPDELGVPHSLKNKSGDIALSVHLYRDMDGLSEGQQIAAKTKFERTPKAPKPAVAPAE
ncbi:cysteine dioxygenase family protein [Acidovorax sp. SUPP2539]|uniref:cysteine dioxygenase n=1 Tax=Acidovorax sp. SUPP2539 TaxID=2920878 RepID=UPI0023DE4D31|nr:cysteine dioxygenase family protein [Acidovorax sp. SUPP2539]GKS88619.1 cysteine dioxygenase family protein [Acidovorax sp. SUPP2539]